MIQIEESNPSFESCSDCIYSDDGEETCIIRRCIHAVAQLNECYVPKQRKKGEWINCNGCFATCSVCGERWGAYGVMNFCPNCGADMREPEDIPMEYFESGGR